MPKNNIHIGSIQSIKDKLAQYNFPAGAYAKFFKSNISSLDDFNHKTVHDLYNICSQDYILTIKVYYILKKNGIILDDWNDKYLFEIVPEKKLPDYGIDIKSAQFHSFPIVQPMN